MKTKWLNQKNNKKLIVFFNGWGMDENAVCNLDYSNYDILMVYDYKTIENIEIPLHLYEKKYLIAWSMGVMTANLFSNILNDFDIKIALAGTPYMINDEFGIYKKIYDLTIKSFNEKSAEKFLNNMGCNIKITRTIEDLKCELINLKNIEQKNKIVFDRAIVPINDKIVPSKNQLSFWKDKAKTIDSTHYVFSYYNSFQEILCKN